MPLYEVTPEFYGSAFADCVTAFGTPAFNLLNSSKADRVAFFADDPEHPALGIVVGQRDGLWLSPFSAPFGEIAAAGNPSDRQIADFIAALPRPMEIVLPAPIYHTPATARIAQALRNSCSLICDDVNYHYDLQHFVDFEEHLNRAARKNYHRALSAGFNCGTTSDAARAYAVIKANRDSHGYNLAMTLEQVLATIAIIPADFFVLTLDGVDVAAAMLYHVAPGIVQVIYWGEAPGYSHLRPMNILPYYIFAHYAAIPGMRYVDIGPASTLGLRNEGLCRFKASLGALETKKPTLRVES